MNIYGRSPVLKNETFPPFRYRNKRARETGVALRGHINHQHGGHVDPNCQACAELSADIKPARRV